MWDIGNKWKGNNICWTSALCQIFIYIIKIIFLRKLLRWNLDSNPDIFDQQVFMLSPMRLWCVLGSLLGKEEALFLMQLKTMLLAKLSRDQKKNVTPGFLNKGKKHRDSDTAMHTQIKKNEEFSIVKGEMLLLWTGWWMYHTCWDMENHHFLQTRVFRREVPGRHIPS